VDGLVAALEQLLILTAHGCAADFPNAIGMAIGVRQILTSRLRYFGSLLMGSAEILLILVLQ
jgi:hypothetical protein